MSRPTFREQVKAGKQQVGGILRMPNESLAEMCGQAGMSFVLFDLEHGPADMLALRGHLIAAEVGGAVTLVRVGSTDPVEIQRVLDLGALGIVVPHVRTPEQAREVVRAAHYPPRGARGLATSTRAGRYGMTAADEHQRTASERTMIIPMFEDPAGCAAADEILSVDGIDGVFVGPADLAQSLEATAGTSSADVPAVTAEVHRVARRHGRLIMSLVSDREGARAALDSGSTLVLYNIQSLLTDTIRAAARP